MPGALTITTTNAGAGSGKAGPLAAPARPLNPVSEWQSFIRTVTSPHTYERICIHLLEVAVILFFSWAAIRIGTTLIQRAAAPLVESEMRRDQFAAAARHRTFRGLLQSLLRTGVYFVAFIGIIATWNIQFLGVLGTALGTAGILGVVVGFGAQKLVRDVITGVFILMEDQYTVGDMVTIGAVTGIVEEVGIRITRIRDEAGRLNMLPNGDISQVTNHSRGPLDAAIEVSFAPDQDLEVVKGIIDRAGKKVAEPEESPFAGPPSLQGITGLDGSKVMVKIVARARPGKQHAAEMALRASVREELQAAGIKLV